MSKISVIIPIYNVEKYIKGCLESICNQTYKDLEIICVNDGTPDNTMAIVEKIAKKDKRIKIINKENGGQSSARNAGLEIATGKYVYFIDSDDQLKENALETLITKMEAEDLDTLYFDAENIYEDDHAKDNSFVDDDYYKRRFKYDKEYTGQSLFVEMKKNDEYRASPCLQMNKLSLLNDNNIRFYEGIIHEDEIFSMQICIYSKKAAHIKELFYIRLVQNESTMSSSKYLKRSKGYFISLLELANLVCDKVEPEYFNMFAKHIKELQTSSTRYLRSGFDVKDPEQFKKDIITIKKELTNRERLYYELLIEKPANYLNEIDEVKERLRKQNSIKFLLKKRIKKVINKIKRVFENISIKVFNKKYISIIMPVYNVEKYLKECLDSLLNQSLREIEIICVDDQSTDSSYEILKEYAAKNKKVIALQQEHSNAGNARNLGIKHAKGKYLLFLDSDDFFSRNLCKRAYHFANYYDLDVLLFNAYKYDNKTKEIENYQTLLNTDFIQPKELYSSEDLKEHLYHVTSACPWTKLFKKKFIKDKGLLFQPLTNSNDVYFTRSSLALADRLMAIDEKLVYYRVNQDKNTQSTKHKDPLNFIKAYLAVKEKLESEGVFDTFYQTYLNVLVTEIVYNYNTTKTSEAKKKIYDYLVDGGFKKLGIKKIDEKLIYAKARYKDFKEIFKNM